MPFKNLTNNHLISLGLCIVLGIFLLPKAAYVTNITPENIIDQVNTVRRDKGVVNLTANQLLAKAAIFKANDIFKYQKFEHNFNDRRFSQWIKDSGYDYSYVGENLAIDFVTSEGAIRAWINSPTHYKNLVNPEFKETGVAVVEGKFNGTNSILIVQIFGTPRTSPNSVATTVSVLPNLIEPKDTNLTTRLSNNLLSYNNFGLVLYLVKVATIYSQGIVGLAILA